MHVANYLCTWAGGFQGFAHALTGIGRWYLHKGEGPRHRACPDRHVAIASAKRGGSGAPSMHALAG
eukprot:362004-Chlamydomonas_euryale.AAC.10